MKQVVALFTLLLSANLFAQTELISEMQNGKYIAHDHLVKNDILFTEPVYFNEQINNKAENNNGENKNIIFIKCTLGFMEYVSLSTGCYIFDDLSFGIMINLTGKKSGMNLPEPNLGIEISKSFNNWDFFINNITISAAKGILETNDLDFHFQCTVGKSANISKGFNFVWGVGILYINNTESVISPILKLGTQINL